MPLLPVVLKLFWFTVLVGRINFVTKVPHDVCQAEVPYINIDGPISQMPAKDDVLLSLISLELIWVVCTVHGLV